jgi:hypothetical protein
MNTRDPFLGTQQRLVAMLLVSAFCVASCVDAGEGDGNGAQGGAGGSAQGGVGGAAGQAGAGGATCELTGSGGAGPGCPKGKKCWFVSGEGGPVLGCVPVGSGDEGAKCLVRTDKTECGGGVVCVVPAGQEEGRCLRFCDPAAPVSCLTSPPETCAPYQPFPDGPTIYTCRK